MSKLAHSSSDEMMDAIERQGRFLEEQEAKQGLSNLRITATNPATLGSLLDLADEATTRRNYEWFRRQPNSPRIDFETYALAYGEKKPADDELREQYERFCADLKRNLPPVEAECSGMPTFNEWKEACGYAD
jgi:hypothetical protein